MAEIGLEDGFFQECTQRYPTEQNLAVPLQPWHRVIWVHWGPEQQGIPSRRQRVFSFAVVRERFAWVGPSIVEEILRGFAACSARKIVLDGDAYMLASEGDIEK
eukprot:180105-Lingulodinium_polyedra.AAC.1